jgi:ribosomal protein L29
MSGNTGTAGGGREAEALVLMVTNTLVYEVRRLGPLLARQQNIILTPDVIDFIEEQIRSEVYNRSPNIIDFILKRQMSTAELGSQITKSVNELFNAVFLEVTHNHRNKIERNDVRKVLTHLFTICPYPFW